MRHACNVYSFITGEWVMHAMYTRYFVGESILVVNPLLKQ